MEGSDQDSDVEETQGILQPTILQQIKKILKEYRNDIQIIKEVIQNADDAGATEMKILYQGTSINPKTEEETKFRKFLRAPALVFYNNSVFTKEDWKGIRSIYTSDKAHDPLKIGRFGLGFKSIFHMTDFPTILSGDRVMFINPNEQDQRKICTSIQLKKLKRSRNLKVSDFLNVFQGTFGFHKEVLDSGCFPATMFLFPLRQEESPLSDTIYSESEVSALFESFIEESDKSILFTKTVCKIQVFVDRPVSDKSEVLYSRQCEELFHSNQLLQCSFGKDVAVYSVEINNESNTLESQRIELNQRLITIGKTVPDTSEHWTFDAFVESKRKSKNGETKESRSRWLIVNYLKGGQLSQRAQTLLKDEDLCFHHVVGIAASLKEKDDKENSVEIGRVFCYQPLSHENRTGLPVHVNALFALGNNRRQIKWEDESGSKMLTDKERDWNHVLISEILPFGYRLLFQEMIELSKRNNNMNNFVKSVYRIIPDIQNTDEKWKELGKAFFELAKDYDMFFTPNEGGQWLTIKDSILLPENETSVNAINQLLIDDQANAARIPQNVFASLSDISTTPCQVSPHFLRNHMLHHISYKKMSRQQKEHLLQYFATDSSFDQLLENLELIPLADKSYACFGGAETIFLESEDVIELFPGMLSNFVDTNLLPETSDIMKHIVESGKLNVKALDAENAAPMIKDILTQQFGRGTVLTLNEMRTTKWKCWIERIWKFMQSRFKNSVSIFESLPIFPFSYKPEWETANEIKLCSLSSTMMYFPQYENREEAEQVSKAFDQMSVNVIRKVPNFIDIGFVDTFITDDRSLSLIQLLECIGPNDIEYFNGKVDSKQQEALLGYLSHCIHAELTHVCLNVLKTLRIFRQYLSPEDRDFRLVSVCENSTLFRGSIFPVRFYKPMIMTSSSTDISLIKSLGVEVVDVKQQTIRVLRNPELYTKAELHKLMTWVLRNPEIMVDKEITMLAKQTPFIESENGMWKKPSELFNPNDELMSKLFKNEGLFPKSSDHNDVQIIQGLIHLGMRTSDTVTAAEIERTCEIIDRNKGETSRVNVEKSEALLKFLNQYPRLINRNFLWDRSVFLIRNVAPDNCLESKNLMPIFSLCPPSKVKSSQYRDLVGLVYYMLDCTTLGNVAEKLGWLKPPEVQDVIRHFENFVRRYNRTMKSACISMIAKIYEWFAEQHRQGHTVIAPLLQTFAEINNNFIWNGDFFVSPKEIYIETLENDLDLHQFVSKLPLELQHLSDFFLSLGCARRQDLRMYLDTLNRINNEATIQQCKSPSVRHVVISILNKLKEEYLNEVKDLNLHFPIQQSDSIHLMMKPANECAYSEANILENFEVGNYEIVHTDVPISTAKALGVPSITQQMLSDSDYFEEWGQEESLPTRIRNLIKHGYEDGFTVIKELFQNADDAGANTFCIMYDERENKDIRKTLISDKMSECQGPAFWVYNDASFSEEDCVNIRKLGIGTKQEYAEKIGRFGVGFCAVYNVTDVPSLISGSNMIIFDPHTSFIEKALPKGRPGIRIDLRKTRNTDVLHTFSDQFKPYENVFGCKINSEKSPFFPGTLFRLPLRTKASEISDNIYTKTLAWELMKSIIENSSNMFLFNQNVKSIKLYHLQNGISNPSDAELVFEVHAQRYGVLNREDKCDCTQVVREVCERQKTEMLERQPLKQLEERNISASLYQDIYDDHSLQLNANVTWITSWATGTNLDFLHTSYESKELLPLASVAVPVETCKEAVAEMPEIRYKLKKLNELPDFFYKSGHFFCFLPTPQEHPFAFHINGKFSLSVDRKTLKTKSDEAKSSCDTHWNEMLMRFPIVSAFQFLLESKLIHQLDPFQLWPISDHDESGLSKCFVDYFYSKITESNNEFPVFKNKGITVGLSQCIFLDSDVRETDVVGDIALKFLETESDECVIDLPRPVFDLLKRSNESRMTNKIITCKYFLLRYFLPKLDELPNVFSKADRDCLLRYAIDQENTDVNNWLKKNKSIPTDSGNLKEPAQIIDPCSKIARLFSQSEGFLPENKFIGNNALNDKLRALGMRTEVLPDDIVLERAKSIANKNAVCEACATDLSVHLLSYISENIDRHVGIFHELAELPFLPVMSKPAEWPFSWRADIELKEARQVEECLTCELHNKLFEPITLEQPNHLYTCDFIELVGCVELIVDRKFYDRLEMEERLPTVTLNELFVHLGVQHSTCTGQFVQQVVSQLISISNNNYEGDSFMTDVTRNVCVRIYDYLEKYSETHQIETLRDKPIVLVNSTFVLPKKVSHDKAIDKCEPFLHSVSDSEIARCPKLCQSLQISDFFPARDIASVLEVMANTNGNTPCTDMQLTACVNLLKLLPSCLEREKIKNVQTFISNEQSVSAIYVPDENGILIESSKLCLDDAGNEKTVSMKYVHASIRPDLAKALNIKGKLLQQLEETAEDVEDFYQEESLCSRLRRLVDGLSYDTGIFKELMQNADDAEASEIVFIKDYSTYPTEHILDENFKPLQGPALCVYNDSAFTKEDLEGIKRLGVGSKGDDPSKSGKYGVGFNVVYNITDAPSFYSAGEELENGETLCIFDPLAQYIPSVSKSKPGKRYKDVKSLRENQSDVLKGYHELKFLQQRNKGTMFRFPLRNEPSEIKTCVIKLPELSDLLEKFCGELKYSMLFLKNLKTVKVLSFANNEYTEDYSIDMELSDVDSSIRCQFAEAHSRMCGSFRKEKKTVFDINQESFTYKISLRETLYDRCTSSSYYVTQTIGFHSAIEIPTLVKDEYESGNIGLLPQGGVAVSMGKEPVNNNGKAFCFLPLPVDTGLPVHVNGHFILDHETRRSLWISKYMDRCFKTQWNLTILNHVVAKSYTTHLKMWKSHLFQDFSKRYLSDSGVNVALDTFYSHFPVYKWVSGFYWEELTKHVYSHLSADHFQFLPYCSVESIEMNRHNCLRQILLSWIPMPTKNDCTPVYFHQIVIYEGVSSLDAILRSLGMKISCLPESIRNSLENCEQPIEKLAPSHVIDYLSAPDNELHMRPAGFSDIHVNQTKFFNESNLQKVFKYCLENEKLFFEKLTDLPICLTQDGMLKTVNASNTLFVTKYTEFFPERRRQFIHECLSDRILQVHVEVQDGEKAKDFEQISDQLFRRFTVHEFNNFSVTDGLFGTHIELGARWDQKHPSKALIKTFWEFFLNQLPAHKYENNVSESPDFSKSLNLIPAKEPMSGKHRLEDSIGESPDFIKSLNLDPGKESLSGEHRHKDSISESLDVIKSLNLIPGKEPITDETVLIAPADIDVFIDLDSFQEGTKLYNVIKKFGIIELDKAVLKYEPSETPTNFSQTMIRSYKEPYNLLIEHIPNVLNPEKVIRCLLQNIAKIRNTDINPEEAALILKYFSDRTSLLQNKEELVNIKKVSVFVLQTDEIKSIDHYHRAVVVPKDIPKQGLELIIDASDIVLLRDLEVKDLFDCLHIDNLPLEKVYTEVIFPHHEVLDRDQFYHHIDFICRAVRSRRKRDLEYLLRKLKGLPFIDVGTNRCVRVQDLFYDLPRRTKFFNLFCKSWEMLPRCFHEEHFVAVFHLLGLQSDMTVDLFERFANEIATDTKVSQPNDERKKSILLIDRLFKMGSRFLQENDFQRFSTIKFIEPGLVEHDLVSLHEQFNNSSLICFADSVPFEERQVCWTTTNILPVWADPVQENAAELNLKLKIRRHPDIDLVIKHCEYIGKELSVKLNALEGSQNRVTEVMEAIYKALDESAEQSNRFEILRDVPIIYLPDRKTVHRASSVVIDCVANEEIVPYVQKSPTRFGQFENLFLKLGAKRQPSLDTYVEIMRQIQRMSMENVILLEQRDAVLKAMVNMFMQLKKLHLEKPFKIDRLYLLSDENLLTDAKRLVIDNNRYLRNRLKRGMKLDYMTTLNDFSGNSIRMDEIIDCLKNVDECSRPSLLTDIVQERVELDNVSWIESYHAAEVENFVHDKLFIISFCRLARHGIRNKLQRQWNEEIENEISECILKIRLKHVEGIQTNLVVNKDVIENTTESMKIHLNVERNRTLVYFDTTGNSSWYTDVTNAIILHLKSVHGCLVDELLFTAQKLFLCKNPTLCEEILDRCGIEAYNSSSVISQKHINEKPIKELEREPSHCYPEAERWQRQAKCDLDSAFASLTTTTGVCYNWVCYMCHQAAEKSLKAAWYAKDANNIEQIGDSHCLQSIAEGLSTELGTLARHLSTVTEWHTRMRYPNKHAPPKIPADYYSRDEAMQVTKTAREILDEVDVVIMSRN